jgi:NAD(P)-dependent dehydrogenase (short-subunit alcohol dehydrogenase family)
MNGCQDKVVGITGVSNGIGAALADELGGRRARVVLAARWREALEAVAKRKVGAEVVPTDVTQRSEAEPSGMRCSHASNHQWFHPRRGCGERQVSAMIAFALSSPLAGMPLPLPPAHGPRVPHSEVP